MICILTFLCDGHVVSLVTAFELVFGYFALAIRTFAFHANKAALIEGWGG